MTDEQEKEMAEILLNTGRTPNKVFMSADACRAFGVDPEPLLNEDGIVEINPTAGGDT
jgi:hypothetical protein